MQGDRPPGPDGLPLLGNLLPFIRDPKPFYERVHREYGGFARLDLPRIGEFYLVSRSDLVETVFRTDAENFRRSQFVAEMFERTLGEGILISDGEQWRQQRARAQPAFHPTMIERYASIMIEHTETLCSDWAPGTPHDLYREMKRLSLLILSDAVFGTTMDYDRQQLESTFRDLQRPSQPSNQAKALLIPRWMPIPMWRRYNRSIDQLDALIEELVDQAESERTLLALLVEATEDGEMSEKLLRDDLVTFLFAGHETTAGALTYTWFLLDDHPEARQRLRDELDEVLGDRQVQYDDLVDLPYTEAVIKESIRLYPPVPMTLRETTEAVDLGGYQLPAGVTVGVSQWLVHRDERHWDAPDEFRPERWLDETDRSEFAYIPFGAGKHRCIGDNFAMTELQLVVAAIAQHYRIEIQSPDRLNVDLGVTARPTDTIRMIPEPTG